MLYLKDEVDDKDALYDKHSKIAKSMSEGELQTKIDLIVKEMHILDVIHNAYVHQTKIYKRPSRDVAQPYWQD